MAGPALVRALSPCALLHCALPCRRHNGVCHAPRSRGPRPARLRARRQATSSGLRPSHHPTTAVRLIKVPSFEQRWRHFPVQLRGLGPARLTRTSIKVFDGLAGLSRQCNLDMERASPPSGGASLSSSLGLQHQMSPDPEGRLLDGANQIGREILRLPSGRGALHTRPKMLVWSSQSTPPHRFDPPV